MVLSFSFLLFVMIFWIALGITEGYRSKRESDILLNISKSAVSIPFLFSILNAYLLGLQSTDMLSQSLLMMMCVAGTGPLYELASNKTEFDRWLMPRNIFYFEKLRKFSPPSVVFPIIIVLTIVAYIILTIGV